MPDERQIALDCAVQALREAGASTCSVMASWPDKDTRTKLMILQQPKPKQALGRGLAEIQGSTVPSRKLLGKATKRNA